jgi:hypothetical protein
MTTIPSKVGLTLITVYWVAMAIMTLYGYQTFSGGEGSQGIKNSFLHIGTGYDLLGVLPDKTGESEGLDTNSSLS